MTNFIKLFALALSISLFTVACDNGTKPTGNAANAAAFFEQQGVKSEFLTVNMGTTAQTVTGSKGTSFTFQPNALLNANGTPFTGTAKVEVKEIYKRADMILSNKPTQTRNGFLVSAGEFFLDVKDNTGKPLQINKEQGIQVEMPLQAGQQRNDRMQLWAVDSLKANDATGGNNGGVNQLPQPAAGGAAPFIWEANNFGVGFNNTSAPGKYVFSVFNKGWTNCDYLYSDPRPKTTLHVNFTTNPNNTNTTVFMVPQGVNSVIALYTPEAPEGRMSYTNSVPIGMQTTLVAISFHNGKSYLASQTIMVGANHTETLTFQEKTDAEITAYMQTLN